MSGVDERPKAEVVEDTSLECLHCGSVEWKRYYTEAGYACYDAGSDTTDWSSQRDFEWAYGASWECADCGARGSVDVCEMLDERY